MRFAFAVVAASGCNQVFGLEQTIPLPASDAAYFDAPADAPYACPPPGQTPQFSRLLHQIPQRCTELSASMAAGHAIAMCFEPTMQIADGGLEGPFTPIAGFETVNKIHYDAPRMMPEGDEVVLRKWDEGTVVGIIGVYRRDAQSALTYSHEIKLPNNQTTDSFVRYGSPSRGPVRRMFYRNNVGALGEMEVAPDGTSTLIDTYTESSLGVTTFAGLPPSLTPDGLRIVFYAGAAASGIFYADRESLADRFRPATLLMNVPPSSDAFMTDNCERIYFSAIGSMFWVQQL